MVFPPAWLPPEFWIPISTTLPNAAPQGGKEAAHSNAILHRLISEVLDARAPSVGSGLVSLVTSRDDIDALLKLDDVIDLVIPRGGNALVRLMLEIWWGLGWDGQASGLSWPLAWGPGTRGARPRRGESGWHCP